MATVKSVTKKLVYDVLTEKEYSRPVYSLEISSSGHYNKAELCIYPQAYVLKNGLSAHSGRLRLTISAQQGIGSTEWYALRWDLSPRLFDLGDAEELNAAMAFEKAFKQEGAKSLENIIKLLEKSGYMQGQTIWAGLKVFAIHQNKKRFMVKAHLGHTYAHIWAKDEETARRIWENRFEGEKQGNRPNPAIDDVTVLIEEMRDQF